MFAGILAASLLLKVNKKQTWKLLAVVDKELSDKQARNCQINKQKSQN